MYLYLKMRSVEYVCERENTHTPAITHIHTYTLLSHTHARQNMVRACGYVCMHICRLREVVKNVFYLVCVRERDLEDVFEEN